MQNCNREMALLDSYMSLKKYSRIMDELPSKEMYPLYYKAHKHEFIINEGEMLFIPAGWFHFVFSEDPNTTTGLNFALNFWYNPVNNWKDGDPSCLLPSVQKHELSHLTPQDVFKPDEKIRCIYSKLNGIFPSNRLFGQFKNSCHEELMTFDEFNETKNPKYYIVQQESNQIDQYAPKYSTTLYKSSAWINFGNIRSFIHYDEHDNWLCQIQGKRRVLLFPHEDRQFLYMFNDMPMNIYNSVCILEDNNKHYIQVYKNILSDYVCNKYSNQTGIVDDQIMHDIYKKTVVEYYEGKLFSIGINIKEPPIPENFTIFNSERPLETISQKYPIIVMMMVKGMGALTIRGYADTMLKAGDIVCFPHHFTYSYYFKGHLKFICPN